MRLRNSFATAALAALAVSLIANDALARKTGRKKRGSGETIEAVKLRELPAAVIEAAEKEAPDVRFTAADRNVKGKRVESYRLYGSNGREHVTLVISPAGKILKRPHAAAREKRK